MTISIPKGVFDILPFDPDPQGSWKLSHYWNWLEDSIRQTTAPYGYKEIRTPIFEKTELFQRGVGESSDIVTKEMYTFIDKGERSMTLRPEGTASVMRAFIEKQLYQHSAVHKFFYIGPMFRYERPQAGRYRQHHQFGLEAVGYASPEQDAEVIDLIHSLYSRLGLKNLIFHLNSVGDEESRSSYKKALQEYLSPHFEQLSGDSKKRFHLNPLRILDSKDAQDKELLQGCPTLVDHLTSTAAKHFEEVCKLLQQLNIPYTVNHNLVRGLDYYTHTVFEVTSGDLGAHNSIGGGGRYDALVKMLGGPDTPSVGFATGLERIIQSLIAQKAPLPAPKRPQLFLIPLGDTAREACFKLLHDLRMQGISAEMDFSHKKLKTCMKFADSIAAEHVAVIGGDELKEKKVELKLMSDGSTQNVPFEQIAAYLRMQHG